MSAFSPAVANEFLRLAKSSQPPVPLTQMQVQKLVFFAHGWTLAITGQPLTSDDPQAFEYGPVYEYLWKALTHYGKKPIDRLVKNREFFPGLFMEDLDAPASGIFSSAERAVIKRVFELYSKYDAFQLSALTHQPKSPWDIVYSGGKGKFSVIDKDIIKEYFSEM